MYIYMDIDIYNVFCLQENPRHDSIAIKICNEVLSNPDSFNLKLWVKILNKLELSESNDEAFKELAVLADQMLEVKICNTFAFYQHMIMYMYEREKSICGNIKISGSSIFVDFKGIPHLQIHIPNKFCNTFSIFSMYEQVNSPTCNNIF